jgi:hypothetical protein
MDSDQGKGDLKPAVKRLRDEIRVAQTGGTWITAGYTIENYVDPNVLETAIRSVHPSVAKITNKTSDVDPFTKLVTEDRKAVKQVDKVAVALAVAAQPASLGVLDLKARIDKLVAFIRESTREPAVATPVVAEAREEVE